MRRPPPVILIISSFILFILFLQNDFDYSELTSIDSPLKFASISLSIVTSIGLLFRQVWAWNFVLTISSVKFFSSLSLLSSSVPSSILFAINMLFYHGLILYLLFHKDTSKYFDFELTSQENRTKQFFKSALILFLLMVPVVWLTLAFNR